jgi:hypothetical protein
MAKKTAPKGITGFEFGAHVLDVSVNALVKIYETTVSVMVEGIKAGKTNTPLGLIHTLGYYSLLHGGAYAAPINQRPFYLKNPATSPYYSGELQNLVNDSWVAWLANSTAGTSASKMANEILIDANVPHVFPKLLDDETFAQMKILYAQAATTDLFQKSATGVTTLVEGITKGLERVGVEEGEREDEDTKAALRQNTRALTTLIGKLG